MADHDGRGHADGESRVGVSSSSSRVDLICPFSNSYSRLQLLLHRQRDRLQALDKQARDAGNELHHRADRHAELEDRGDGIPHGRERVAAEAPDQATDDDAQKERFAKETELALQSLGIEIEPVKAGNAV